MNTEIPDANIQDVWEVGKQYFSEKGMPRVAAAMEFTPSKIAACELVLEVPNGTLKAAVEDHKQEIAQYFKQQFQLPEFAIQVKVKKELAQSVETPKQLKSAQQKFKELSALNPELILLIEKLGMEPTD